jgi:hypothetical protein
MMHDFCEVSLFFLPCIRKFKAYGCDKKDSQQQGWQLKGSRQVSVNSTKRYPEPFRAFCLVDSIGYQLLDAGRGCAMVAPIFR